jgi:hypothetical protein
LVHLVVGTKLQRLQMAGIAHHRWDVLAIDHGKKHFADDPIELASAVLASRHNKVSLLTTRFKTRRRRPDAVDNLEAERRA